MIARSWIVFVLVGTVLGVAVALAIGIDGNRPLIAVGAFVLSSVIWLLGRAILIMLGEGQE